MACSSGAPGPLVVTGYGPFTGHPVNASWETVKAVQANWDKHKHSGVDLVTSELPVAYDSVLECVPQQWAHLNPLCYVHVGVHGSTQDIRLEKFAHNSGYDKPDIKLCFPPEGKCDPSSCPQTEERLQTSLDVDALAKAVNDSSCPIRCCPSEDAGRYLCEFVLYKSLKASGGRSVFVHVPPLNKPFSVSQLAQALEIILQAVIEQCSA